MFSLSHGEMLVCLFAGARRCKIIHPSNRKSYLLDAVSTVMDLAEQ